MLPRPDSHGETGGTAKLPGVYQEADPCIQKRKELVNDAFPLLDGLGNSIPKSRRDANLDTQ